MTTVQAGQRLTAATLNAFAFPQAVIKPTDTSRASNTTLANDPALTLPVLASATYLVQCVVQFEAAGGGDMKFQWTVPSGAVLAGAVLYRNLTPADTVHGVLLASTVLSAAGSGAATLLSLSAFGSLVMSSTPGNLTLQWAQNSSSGTATIVHAGSTIALWRIT